MTPLTDSMGVCEALGVRPPLKGANDLTLTPLAALDQKKMREPPPLAEAIPDSGKLDLIVAILFELLHRATPDEAVPAVSRRLTAVAPAYSETWIAETISSAWSSTEAGA